MGRIYYFRSDLPPDQLPEVLHDWWADGAHVRVRWKGGRFTVTRTVETRGEGGQTCGAGWTFGVQRSWQWNDPFCGRVCPDGRGGSLLTGRFRIHPVGRLLLFAAFPLWLAGSLAFWPPHSGEALLTAAAAVAVWLTLVVRSCRNLDTGDGTGQVLQYLREHFQETGEGTGEETT